MTLEKAIELIENPDNYEKVCEYGKVLGWLRELKERRAADVQLAEAKRLLKLAVEDFAKMDYHIFDCDTSCDDCPLSGERDHCLKWRHYDEVEKLLKES